ncbi:MHYT domain-containing signal sensor [Catellatospora sp. IY07-71]|uniref:MHYT domain-containing protein n=1 Tax=Catellatospora sp. IY07-71 TaxID=2728827 RepID=UPI001BB3F40A|nr:MHYT domain-containing protein [Catellatospora sp. IY07-71]BCJ70632.1 MHYT domain-containing signal sensor [Catellatospora sp. IY07-71]
MAEVHHFAYGWFNPVAAYLMAFIGSLLGLVCTARARRAPTGGRRARWLIIASLSIGGTGIWFMHFMAIIGFDVPDSPVRYDAVVTFISLALAVATVGIGLFIAGQGPRSALRVVAGGGFTGLGMVAMHYTGMAGMRVAGDVGYDLGLVGASVLIAVVAATVALWFTVTVSGRRAITAAAAVMGVAVCGMHYTAMAAVRITLRTDGDGEVSGLSPFVLIVPIVVLSALCLIGVMFSALQAMMQEEFDGTGVARPGPHAANAALVIPDPRGTDDEMAPVNPPFSLARALADRNSARVPH